MFGFHEDFDETVIESCDEEKPFEESGKHDWRQYCHIDDLAMIQHNE